MLRSPGLVVFLMCRSYRPCRIFKGNDDRLIGLYAFVVKWLGFLAFRVKTTLTLFQCFSMHLFNMQSVKIPTRRGRTLPRDCCNYLVLSGDFLSFVVSGVAVPPLKSRKCVFLCTYFIQNV